MMRMTMTVLMNMMTMVITNPKKLHEHERMDNLYSHLFTGELDDENDDDCVDDEGEDDELPRNFLNPVRQ